MPSRQLIHPLLHVLQTKFVVSERACAPLVTFTPFADLPEVNSGSRPTGARPVASGGGCARRCRLMLCRRCKRGPCLCSVPTRYTPGKHPAGCGTKRGTNRVPHSGPERLRAVRGWLAKPNIVVRVEWQEIERSAPAQLARHDAGAGPPRASARLGRARSVYSTRTAVSAGFRSRCCSGGTPGVGCVPWRWAAEEAGRAAGGHVGGRADGLVAPGRGGRRALRGRCLPTRLRPAARRPAARAGQRALSRAPRTGLYRWVADHRSLLGRPIPASARRWADRVISGSRPHGR